MKNAFVRKLPEKGVDALSLLASEKEPNWWRDMLGRWTTSGHEGKVEGLRLAIRNNYLNLYSHGQSIAAVRFDSSCKPYASIHGKYLDEGFTGQTYGRVAGSTISLKDQTLIYGSGGGTASTWIKRAFKHSGQEKRFVERIVAANENVIDLEVGLPAWELHDQPQRIDIAAIERDGEGPTLTIAFYEVKSSRDPRVRASITSEKGVVRQLERYEAYLQNETYAKQVADAYRETCRLLVGLYRMAGAQACASGRIGALAKAIELAAKPGTHLVVDPRPRLVIFRNDDGWGSGWDEVAERLREAGWPPLVLKEAPYRLRRPA